MTTELQHIRNQIEQADQTTGALQIGYILNALNGLVDYLEEGERSRRVDGPFASLRDMRYTTCPCGCGSKEICDQHRAQVAAHNAAIPF